MADGKRCNSGWLAHQGLQVDAFASAERGVDEARALARCRGMRVTFAEALLRRACRALEIVELRGDDAVLREGMQHIGMAALIGPVARHR